MARYALALFWLGLLAGVGPAAAQSRINRCIHHDGHAVYTDQACTDLRLATWPRTGSTLRPPFAPPPHGCARDRNDLQ